MTFPLKLTAPDGTVLAQAYIHQMLNFRYHWHRQEYELFLLLQGRAIVNRGEEIWDLSPGDLLLIDPGCAHASCAQQPGTRALILRFSAFALPSAVKAGQCPSFSSCVAAQGQSLPQAGRLRRCAAGIVTELALDDPFSRLSAQSWFQLLTACLCRYFSGPTILCATELEGASTGADRITEYLHLHYAEKVTLNDLAEFTGYNRTYLSTFLKIHTGTSFHEYLTRIRFQHAVHDLTYTSKTLTEVALDNGFPELKLFNSRFRATFRQSPAEYRTQLAPELTAGPDLARSYCDPCSHEIQQILGHWLIAPEG